MAGQTGALSPLEQLKARREELVAEDAGTVIPVPGWSDVECGLRIHALPHSIIRAQAGRMAKAKGPARRAATEMSANAAIIAHAVDAVIIGAGAAAAEYDLLDPGLAGALGVEGALEPLTVLKALCLGKDGAVLMLSQRVQEHSGYVRDEVDEDWLGG